MTQPTLPEARPRVLVVDDEKFIREILAEFLGMEGYLVRTAEEGASEFAELGRTHYDLVISDLKMPKMGGMELLEAMAKVAPNALTVIMTGFGTVETAIDAMKRGAYDYILKPFKVEEVTMIVQRGLEKQRLSAENLRLKEALGLYKVSEAIAASLSLDEVLNTVADSALNEMHADLVSTWLDDGEGSFFERQHIVSPALKIEAKIPRLKAEALASHFAQDPTLVEQGARGMRFFEGPVEPTLQSFTAVPLRMKQRLSGFIAVASVTGGKRFDEGQRKLLAIIGSPAPAATPKAPPHRD